MSTLNPGHDRRLTLPQALIVLNCAVEAGELDFSAYRDAVTTVRQRTYYGAPMTDHGRASIVYLRFGVPAEITPNSVEG